MRKNQGQERKGNLLRDLGCTGSKEALHILITRGRDILHEHALEVATWVSARIAVTLPDGVRFMVQNPEYAALLSTTAGDMFCAGYVCGKQDIQAKSTEEKPLNLESLKTGNIPGADEDTPQGIRIIEIKDGEAKEITLNEMIESMGEEDQHSTQTIASEFGIPEDQEWKRKQVADALDFLDSKNKACVKLLANIVGETTNTDELLSQVAIARTFFSLAWMVKEYDHRGTADK